MKKQVLGLGLWVVLGLMLACRLPFLNENVPLAEDAQEVGMDEGNGLAPSVSTPGTDCPITIENVTPPQALDPKSLHYVGAFRLPDDSGGLGWDYSGNGMTYTPQGDPHGEEDGFPGSLFVVGQDHQLQVAEISIPVPVVSKNLAELNSARTLQPFADITGGSITEDLSLSVMGIEYLPAQIGMDSANLYFSIGQHFQVFDPSHGWASLDLSVPNPVDL